MEKRACVILGGGSAGMAAALSAKENGIDDLLILEREKELGGILQQCIHNGFGLHTFKEELTGPQYAQRYIDMIHNRNIDYQLESTVVNLTSDKVITVFSPTKGIQQIQAQAIIIATGCRERTRGAIDLRGYRPQGIYTAGCAQKYLNMEGWLVGKRVFILGSGDIGLIMARRMVLEGACVLGVAELMPYSNGLARNIKQCLEDFDIPLYLSHTITHIDGKENLECITISQVDDQRKPISGTEKTFEVDTLLLSVGLIPENQLSELAGFDLHDKTKGLVVDETCMSEIEGIFSCGNALHVHDLVDFVSQEGTKAGKGAADFIQGKYTKDSALIMQADSGISYVLPQQVHPHRNQPTEFLFRVTQTAKNARIRITSKNFTKEIKKRVLAPAEMEKITLTAEELNQCSEVIHWEVIA